MSPLVHSRNVFFLNNRVDFFSLSLSFFLKHIFVFSIPSMESSMQWDKMTFSGKECLVQASIQVQQGLLGAQRLCDLRRR